MSLNVNPISVTKDWMRIAGQDHTHKVAAFYIGMILEEVAELLEAQEVPSGFIQGIATLWKQGSYRFINNEATLDAFADILWVAASAGHAMGADMQGAFDAVTESNCSKFVESDTGELVALKDVNGKVKKGPNYKAVNLSSFMKT